MSNVIKASTIRYNNDKVKQIDLNQKADEFQRLYIKNHLPQKQERVFLEGEEGADGFSPGISAIPLDAAKQENTLTQEQYSKMNEQRYAQWEEEKKLLLAQAQEEAAVFLENTKKEANSILEEAKRKAESKAMAILRKAQDEGYAMGKTRGEEELQLLKEEFKQEVEEFRHEQELIREQIEPEVVDILIKLVKKLTGIAIEERKDIILYLVEQSLLGLENSKSFIIRVSREDYDTVYAKKAELLWKLKEGTELEIMDDALLTKSQCLIETESRVIDCSLDVQLGNLIENLKMLAGSRNEGFGTATS